MNFEDCLWCFSGSEEYITHRHYNFVERCMQEAFDVEYWEVRVRRFLLTQDLVPFNLEEWSAPAFTRVAQMLTCRLVIKSSVAEAGIIIRLMNDREKIL